MTSADTLIVCDDGMIEHDPGPGHPECPDRLRAIRSVLDARPVAGTRIVRPPEADLDDLQRVHAAGHVARIEAARGRRVAIDPDTHMSPGSARAGRLAAGAAVLAVDAVIEGTARNAFAFVRPPGHHAEPARAMGFCLYNNVAIAAARARAVHGIERVLVVDWDVHHGNGTQAAFYASRDVLFVSTHQFPFYPGTGADDEQGRGEGRGYTVNVPLSRGATDGDYVRVFEDIVQPIADAYTPQLVLVSAGFDAHAADPLGGMRLSTDVFAELCATMRSIAATHADGRLVLMLEGGYDLDALADSCHACVQVLAGAAAPGVRGSPTPHGEGALRRVTATQRAHWPV